MLVLFSSFLISCGGDDNNDSEMNECTSAGALNSQNITATTAEITWSHPSDSGTTYTVEYGLAGFNTGNGTTAQTTNKQITLNDLTPSSNYQYYVSTFCENGITAELSGPQSFTTLDDNSGGENGGGNANCNNPGDFGGEPSSSGRIIIYWNTEGETAWRVEYGVSGFSIGSGIVTNTSENGLAIDGLNSGVAYDFYVQANCGAEGFSDLVGPLILVPN